jgi:Domain of unknown function (DUF3846)
MQGIVGGHVQCVTLDDGVDVWCNEDALSLGLPLNRVVAAAPRSGPTLFGEPVDIIYADPDLARPGEPGQWRFHGDFFMACTDDDGELADIDDASVMKYTTMFDAEDNASAWLGLGMTDPRRLRVFGALDVERAAQDKQWGGPSHDDEHARPEWLDFIEHQIQRAGWETTNVGYRNRLIKIAALAVAAIESHDRITEET